MSKKLLEYDPAFFAIVERIARGGEVSLSLDTPGECESTRNEFYRFRQVLREFTACADRIEASIRTREGPIASPSGPHIVNELSFKRGESIYATRLNKALQPDSDTER